MRYDCKVIWRGEKIRKCQICVVFRSFQISFVVVVVVAMGNNIVQFLKNIITQILADDPCHCIIKFFFP